MLNYLKKFALDILPSVAATIIGAYIVNHYISARPAEAPVAAIEKPLAEKSAYKPAETASIPAAVDTRRKPSPPREKPVAKITPPQVAAPVTAPSADTGAVPDERR